MLTFANEIIAHMNQMGGIVEKEKSKRKADVETKTESDKLEVCRFDFTGFKLISVSDAPNRALYTYALDQG